LGSNERQIAKADAPAPGSPRSPSDLPTLKQFD
jgi:hypothetical protein